MHCVVQLTVVPYSEQAPGFLDSRRYSVSGRAISF